MFTVVFEVHPGPGKKDQYLALAKHLKPMLESGDGFIDNERFESRRREGWMLSLSTWRDEKSLVRWRSHGEHHRIQEQGRMYVFSDYRLRVCGITLDTHPPAGVALIEQRFDATESGSAKALALTEVSPAASATWASPSDRLPSRLGLDESAAGLDQDEVFESITEPGKLLLLTAWRSAADCARWIPSAFDGVAELRHRRLRTIRDYGMFDRREAAQFLAEPNAAAARGPAAGRR